jgi:hypothetical protein
MTLFAKKNDKIFADAYAAGSTDIIAFDIGLKELPEELGT